MSITTAISTLATRLGAVATTRIGRDALETTSATLPIITIWSTGDALATAQDYYDYPVRTRTIAIEYKLDGEPDDYHEDLDAALAALLAVIAPDAEGTWLAGAALELRASAVRWFHPGNGSNLAAVQFTVDIDYAA